MRYQVLKDTFNKIDIETLWLTKDQIISLTKEAYYYGNRTQTGRSQITLVIGEICYILNLDVTKG